MDEVLRMEPKNMLIMLRGQQILEIENDLSHDHKEINPDVLRAYIYAMNGDYSLASDDIIHEVTNIIMNVDNSAINIIRASGFYGGTDDFDDEFSPMSSLSDIFTDTNDYEFSQYMQDKYNTLKRKIYTDRATSEVIEEIDSFTILVYKTYTGKPLVLPDGTTTSLYKVSDEAKYLTLRCILSHLGQLIISPNGGNRSEMIHYEDPDIQVDIQTLADGLRDMQDELYNKILDKASA